MQLPTTVLLKMLLMFTGASAGIEQPALMQDDSPGALQPEAPPHEPSEGTASRNFADASELLEALETADAGLERLVANIRYTKAFAIQGDTQTRAGRLVFINAAPESEVQARKFAIRFDSLITGTRVDEQVQEYVFDGEWLAERYPDEHQFIRRQVVPPGERWDPLRIGEGPFPVPLGQKREDILREYDAELLPSEDGLESATLRAFAAACWQLRLTPRAELAEDAELAEIRLWYQKSDLLPRLARTVNSADDVSVVQLTEVRTNAEAAISDGELSTEPPPAEEGWSQTIEPWRG